MNKFIGGLIAGALISVAILANSGFMKEADIKKTACEQSLPRNQNCVLQYIPKANK